MSWKTKTKRAPERRQTAESGENCNFNLMVVLNKKSVYHPSHLILLQMYVLNLTQSIQQWLRYFIHAGRWRKKSINKVIRIHPTGTINVCTNFHFPARILLLKWVIKMNRIYQTQPSVLMRSFK